MQKTNQAVFLLSHRGVMFHRLGETAKRARRRLRVDEKEIKIMDKGKPQ